MGEIPRACITCGKAVYGGRSRCPAHTWKSSSRWAQYAAEHPDRASFYRSGGWRERRARHLLENPDCVICGQPATAVDHIINLASGGTFDGPLQSLCTEHHRRKTQNESKQATSGRQPEGGREMLDSLSAHHESGHAVISFLLGEMPETVTIQPDATSDGHVEYLGVLARSLIRSAATGTSKWDQKRIEANLVVRAAGPMAQALHMRRGSPTTFIDRDSWATFDGAQDYDVAESLRENTRKRLPVYTLDHAAEQAHELLRRRDTWESVQRVAKVLVRFRSLGYDDLRLLVY